MGKLVSMKIETQKDAHFSQCGKHRYWLSRVWDDKKPIAMLIMLNPSTADGFIDDRTIQKCIRLLHKDISIGGFKVCNVYSYRETSPDKLFQQKDIIGKDNDTILKEVLEQSRFVVCAWSNHVKDKDRVKAIYKILDDSHKPTYCFGLTKKGNPRHPLYLKSDTVLMEYNLTVT